MLLHRSNFVRAYWAITFASFVAAGAMVIWYAPREATMGIIQKVFYLHLPAAIATLLACMLTFIAGIGHLAQRRAWWDDLGSASARVAVQLCAVVLLTGMIWGRSAWGQWWTWSPRLTFTLLLFLLYVVYMVIRASVDPGPRRAMICAVYGIIAFLDVPLVYLSTKLMPDIHPSSIQLAAPMKLTLLACMGPVLLLSGGLVAARYALNRKLRGMEMARVAPPLPSVRSLQPIGGMS